MNTQVWELLDEETRAQLREQFPEIEAPQPRKNRRSRRHHDVRLRDSSRDMTITIHAQERMEQRWPKLVQGLSDEEIARVIQGEINDAILAGRKGIYCPIELANNAVERWRARSHGWYAWNADKKRGYACRDDKKDGVVVMTTLVGVAPQKARQKLKRK